MLIFRIGTVVIVVGLVLFIWAILHKGKTVAEAPKEPQTLDPFENRPIGVWAEDCEGGSITNIKTDGIDFAVVSKNNRDTKISGVEAINVPQRKAPELEAAKEPVEKRRKFFSGWRPDKSE